MSDNIQVLDATATSVTMRSTDSAGVQIPHHIVDSSALPTGAATQTTLAALLAAIGDPSDAAWTSGSGSVIAILKAIATP